MPPREEEETMALVANQQQTNLGAKPFLSEKDGVDPSTSCSIRSLSERSITLIEMFEEEDLNGSLLVEACRGCLQNQVTSMVNDVQTLLMEQNTDDDDFSWRASLAQLQADTYLQVIESALKTSDRERVEEALKFFVNSIGSQLGRDEQNEGKPSTLVRISAWKMPDLAFEVSLSHPMKYVLPLKPEGLPLTLEARAIVELLVEDIVGEKKSTTSPQACIVHLERCTHETRPYSDSSGTTGDALVRARVSPASEKVAVANKGKPWRESKIIGSGGLRVKEARM
jgi:hypothetical protein